MKFITYTFKKVFSVFLDQVPNDSDINFDKHDGTLWWSKIRLAFRRTRGTFASMIATSVGDALGTIAFYGHDGTSFVSKGAIESYDNGSTGSMVVDNCSFIPNMVMTNAVMINGYFTRTLSGSNLVVTLLTEAGTAPTSQNPVKIYIGGQVRKITSALTKTFNAGTNFFHLGDAEFATLEVELFTYLLWDGSSIRIICSRIPYALKQGDFDLIGSPWLNEKGYDGSGSGFASSNPVVNIGRFNVILSGGAGYTWSIPATDIVVNGKCTETRPLTWKPVYTGFSADPTSNPHTYILDGYQCFTQARENNAGTSNATTFTKTYPFTARDLTTGAAYTHFTVATDNSADLPNPGYVTLPVASKILTCYTTVAAGAWNATGTKRIKNLAFSYLI